MSRLGPSPHLTWRELACKDAICTPYPLDYRADGRLRPLVLGFELIRQACGNRPIHILSAYRTEAYNALVGGAPRSLHVAGKALDLQTPAHLTLEAFHATVVEVARETPYLGAVGVYQWGVHIDTRPRLTQALTQWDLRVPIVVRT